MRIKQVDNTNPRRAFTRENFLDGTYVYRSSGVNSAVICILAWRDETTAECLFFQGRGLLPYITTWVDSKEHYQAVNVNSLELTFKLE